MAEIEVLGSEARNQKWLIIFLVYRFVYLEDAYFFAL